MARVGFNVCGPDAIPHHGVADSFDQCHVLRVFHGAIDYVYDVGAIGVDVEFRSPSFFFWYYFVYFPERLAKCKQFGEAGVRYVCWDHPGVLEYHPIALDPVGPCPLAPLHAERSVGVDGEGSHISPFV